jgi:hypothetical protein
MMLQAVEIECQDDLKVDLSFSSSNLEAAMSSREILEKARGDPMLAMKKKEQAMLREMMNNPMR